MVTKKWWILGAAAVVTFVISASAVLVSSKTFRTTALLLGVAQKTGAGLPVFDYSRIAGFKLVNLAMGRSESDTTVTNQVLVMTFPCDLSTAQLAVYDKNTSNVVVAIADSSGLVDSVQGVGISKTGKTNSVARFVTQLIVNQHGNLSGGFLTVAGRVHINPITGCPEAVTLSIDKDPADQIFGDLGILNKDDSDSEKLVKRTGLAHVIGVLDVITGGQTNPILIPYGGLDIRTGRVVLP